MIKYIYTLIITLLFSLFGFSQTKSQHHHDHDDDFAIKLIEKKLNSFQHIFDADSLNGFNNEAAWQQASNSGAPDWEQKIQISLKKRRYINTKYNICIGKTNKISRQQSVGISQSHRPHG